MNRQLPHNSDTSGPVWEAAREAELCDLIDARAGALRSTVGEPLVADAVQADKRLQALALDAAYLREFGADVAAPTAHAMVAAIEEQLSQEALRELLDAERQAPALPIADRRGAGFGSTSGLREGVLGVLGLWSVLARSVAVQRVAMAAGVALALGGAWLVVQGVKSAWPAGGSGGQGGMTIARGGAGANADSRGDAGSGDSADAHALMNGDEHANTDAADATATALAADGANAAGGGAGDGASGDALASTEHGSGESGAPVAAPMSIERALALAQQGRLVVRVRTNESAPLERRLDSMADRGVLAMGGLRIAAGRLDRLNVDALPTHLASLAQPRIDAAKTGVNPGVPGRLPGAPVVASDGGTAGERFTLPTVANGFGAIAALRAQTPTAEVERVYLAELPASAADLASLRALVSAAMSGVSGAPAASSETNPAQPAGTEDERGERDEQGERVEQGVRVEFEELASNADAPAPSLLSGDLDSERVLWWTSPADAWVVGVRVPIVVQTQSK